MPLENSGRYLDIDILKFDPGGAEAMARAIASDGADAKNIPMPFVSRSMHS